MQVPEGVPAMAEKYAETAHRWHVDAFLARIDVHNYLVIPGEEPNHNVYSVTLYYYSPSAHATQAYVVGPDGQSYPHPAAPTDTTRLPAKFVDLPEAFSAASAKGLGARLQSATLRWVRVPNADSQAAWDLLAPGGSPSRLLVMAESGQALRTGDLCTTCVSGATVTNAEAGRARTVVAHTNSAVQASDHIPAGQIEGISYTFVPLYRDMVRCSDPAQHPVMPNPYTSGCHPAGKDLVGFNCLSVVKSQDRYFFVKGNALRPQWCSIDRSHQFHVDYPNGTFQIYIDFDHSDGLHTHQLAATWQVLRYDRATCIAQQPELQGALGAPCP
jgi:hypothetical protein